MPSTSHPQAKFDPLPPDLDLDALVEKTENFDFVIRITTEQIDELGLAEFEKLVLLHVIIGGRPLVVEGWQKELPPWVFSPAWLQENIGKKEEVVRDIVNGANMPMTIGHYLGAMEKLTRQWTPTNFRDDKRQRLYLKDIDCPGAWHSHLEKIIPQTLFYMNESTGERGGPGYQNERNQYNQITKGKGIAPSGDLMSNLPPEMRAQNMMCYIGHEGTYTPAHREMCATLGQNVMVETSAVEKGEKPGSSIWFMTESKDREVVSEYFLSMLGHDIEVESHFAQVNAWKKAPFPVYIVEQKVGDFILIPPLAPHQVWNRGTRTMKAAWNRTTVETLELALREALPQARMVCRDEQYKCKAIVYYSLHNYADRLRRVMDLDLSNYPDETIHKDSRIRQLRKDFRKLFSLYTQILVGEMFSPDLPPEKEVEFVEFDSNITCSYCRCNIFNKFLTCKTCIGQLEDGGEDTYDVCLECYAMGRSCGCISNLTWVEQWPWSDLEEAYNQWRELLSTNGGGYIISKAPPTLLEARTRSAKKPVAQICQEQLRLRPWKDINKIDLPEPMEGDSDLEPEVDDEGRLKKKKLTKRQSTKLSKNIANCHICKEKELKWRMAFCTKCSLAYCYGTLWRAFDLKPQDVMEDPDWVCPYCRNICSCGKCRKDIRQNAYRPKGTLLGHDTRKVADPRSVESLVDFSRTNLTWLRGDGDDDPKNSERMRTLKERAEAQKSQPEELPEDDNVIIHAPITSPHHESITSMHIDPSLQDGGIESNKTSHSVSGIRVGRDGSSMLSMAIDGSAETFEVSHTGGTPQGIALVAPSAVMMTPDDEYPDPSVLSRMMGQGYYQQGNTVDRILFDHPDVSTPSGQHINTTYPRLPEEPEQSFGNQKRKRDSIPASADEAHIQYQQFQKKQKLADAKKGGTFFITQNKLQGGSPLMVKLSLDANKDFLKRLYELDNGRKTNSLRSNPRPVRSTGLVTRPSVDNDVEEVIVSSDVQPAAVRKSVYQDPSDDEDSDAMFVDTGTLPVKPKRAPVANMVPKDVVESEKAQMATKGSIDSTKKTTSTAKEIKANSAELASESPEAQQHSWHERRIAQEEAHKFEQEFVKPVEESSRDVTTAIAGRRVTFHESSAALQDSPASPPSHSDFHDEYESFMDVDRNHETTEKPPGVAQLPETDLGPKLSQSSTYLDAKLEALRQAEEEIALETGSTPHVFSFSPINRRPQVPPNKQVVSSTVPKKLPPAPPGKMLSLAERRALAGKSFKIGTSKPSGNKVPQFAKVAVEQTTAATVSTPAKTTALSVPTPKPDSQGPNFRAVPVSEASNSDSSSDEEEIILARASVTPSGGVVFSRGISRGRPRGRGRGRGRGRARGRGRGH